MHYFDFHYSWEQRKLGEVLKERTERAKGDEELLSVTIANGVIRQIDSEKRNTASEDRSNYKIVKKGDVPYNSMRMWQGAVGNSKYNGIVSPAYTILTPTSEANGKFFMELFKKKSTLQIFQRWSQGLTSDTWNLKYPILSSIQFAIPSVEEQEKIAEYFSSLDHLITLHQCKCQIDGCRFQSPLAITWEQRKVSELFRVTRGYVLAATQTETTKTDEKPYPVYSSQTKDKGLMGYYKDYLYEDAITWTTDGANAGTVNYRAGKFYCTNVCGVLLSNEVKANQMIAEALNSVAKGYVSYVGNPKLMNNVMADIVIQIPTQAEEREQLSSFFAKLDNLITLHQCE